MEKSNENIPKRELTLGEKRVGLTFNPSNNGSVENFKRRTAYLIDSLEKMKKGADGEKIRSIARAQSFYEDACMNAVKAHFKE